ncbi:MAG: hypothetical protein M3680_21000 [Myxococcota bacterium]|nr:hypothetical protein [Myxococcota bacterium]
MSRTTLSHRTFGVALSVALHVGLAAGCATDATPETISTEPRTIHYARDIQPIFDRWCTDCHYTLLPRLTALSAPQDLQHESLDPCGHDRQPTPYLVPGDPAASFLFYKLTGEPADAFSDAAGCDRLMPATEAGPVRPLIDLDPAAVEAIRRWIAEGASFD